MRIALWAIGVFAAGAVYAGTTAAAAQWTIGDPGQGPVALPYGPPGAHQLSGISWAEGTRWYAVADKGGMAFPLSIDLDPNTGTVVHATIDPGVRLAGADDLEGVVYDPARHALIASDEVGPTIREYRLSDGSVLRSIAVPPVYRTARKNLSLESLSANADHTALWTANEETLDVDGPLSSEAEGSIVRLQRFDAAFRPDGQWAYRTDPLPGLIEKGARHIESSGVSDLVALPDGGLLALERAFGIGGFRMRLYEVSFAGATDVSAIPHLTAARYTPVSKRLLWERTVPDFNFEGAGLGPPLAGGARSLMLVADDGHGFRTGVYPLTLRK